MQCGEGEGAGSQCSVQQHLPALGSPQCQWLVFLLTLLQCSEGRASTLPQGFPSTWDEAVLSPLRQLCCSVALVVYCGGGCQKRKLLAAVLGRELQLYL